MTQPTKKQILEWYKFRFPRNFGKDFDKGYMNEWFNRFITPQEVWGRSDFESRKALKKFFPKTFGKLKIEDNLYNKEFTNIFRRW